MTLWRGSCHCGAVRFEVEGEFDHVRECNCTVCLRRGALIVRVGADDLNLLTPMGALATYRWGSRTAVDYFCRSCGILPFRRPSHPSPEEAAAGAVPFEGWSVNARCLEGLDVLALPRERIDGAALNLAQPIR